TPPCSRWRQTTWPRLWQTSPSRPRPTQPWSWPGPRRSPSLRSCGGPWPQVGVRGRGWRTRRLAPSGRLWAPAASPPTEPPRASARRGSRSGSGAPCGDPAPPRRLPPSIRSTRSPMKAIRLHAHGGPESLRFEDAPTPRPGLGEVLVRVGAAAVTPTELLWVPTWATRAAAGNLDFVRGLGADEVIDYR